jgi:DNA-binding PadR family transcriptional regulator
MPALSPTSYAVLSQIALRPWSSYELAKHMAVNLRFFFPRAESRIYAELKVLQRRRLLRAEITRVGRRPRTVYSITAAGSRALRQWLAQAPVSPLSLEFEGLLRVFVAHFADKADLARALSEIRAHNQQLIETAGRVAEQYRTGSAPFQRYVHERAFVFDFLARFAGLVRDWADRVEAEVADWRDLAPEGKDARAVRLIGATAAEVLRAGS